MKDEKTNNIHIPDVGEKVFPSDEEIAKASLTVGNHDGITDRKQAFEKGANWMRDEIHNKIEYANHLKSESEKRDKVFQELDYDRQMRKQTLALPDGTTVDLTKPIEVSFGNDRWDSEAEYHYVGLNVLNEIVVENIEDHDLQIAVSIRNKPEPEFKPGDKIFYQKGNDWIFEHYNHSVNYFVKLYPAIVDGNPVYPPFND